SDAFRFLVDVALPEWRERLLRRGELDLRVWCAAASSGE
ncbi:MAG: chemotaxis methyl-accepting protein methylase, partial [Myxococcota bacterium]